MTTSLGKSSLLLLFKYNSVNPFHQKPIYFLSFLHEPTFMTSNCRFHVYGEKKSNFIKMFSVDLTPHFTIGLLGLKVDIYH